MIDLQARSGTQRLHNKYGGKNKVYKSFRIFVKDFIGVLNQNVGKEYYSTSGMLWSYELLFGVDNWDIFSIDFVLKIKLSVFRLLWSCKYYFW